MIWFALISTAILFILLAQLPVQKMLIATNPSLKQKGIVPHKMRPLGFFHLKAKLESAFLLFYELCLPLVCFTLVYQIMPQHFVAVSATLVCAISYQLWHKKSLNLHPLTLLCGFYLVLDINALIVSFILAALLFVNQKKSALSLAAFLMMTPIFCFLLNSNPWLSMFSLAINAFYLYSYKIPLLNRKDDNPWSLRGWI